MSLLSAVIQEADKTNTEDIAKARNDILPKIIDLAERLQVFAWGLQNFYIDVYLTSDSSRSLEQMNYKNRKYRANEDLEELQEEIETYRKQFGDEDEEINNARKKLDAVVVNYNDACALVDGTYIMQKAYRDVMSFKYVDAILSLKNLHTRLDKIPSEGDLATAIRSFRNLSESQLVVSQGQLSCEFSKLFSWNFNRGVNILTYSLSVQQDDPILLENVLRALYIADQMIIDIQPFSHFFVMMLLPNVIKHNCEIYTEDNLGALVFNIKIDLTDPTRPSIPTIFNNLTAAFEFLNTTMGAKLEADKSFFQSVGDCNREEFFSTLIQECIKDNLPYCDESQQAYKEIAMELETFNKFLVNLKYIEADKSPLRRYIDNTNMLMYDTKCSKLLAKARELTKEYLSKGTVIIGQALDNKDDCILDMTNKTFKYDIENPPFIPRFMVSQNVKKLVGLIKKHLEESTELPLEYAHQLVLCIKDIAVMYQALVVQRNGMRLSTYALEIALYFNNCQYLAHCLVGPPWKNVLPKEIAEMLNTILMSYIYDLRIVGIEKLSVYLQRTREAILVKIIGNNIATGSPNEWHMEAFEAFNTDVNQVLGLLREMKSTWMYVLPARMFERAMATMFGSLCEGMLKRMLWPARELTEDVISLIASRFQYTADEILEVFPEIDTMATKQNSWEKFKHMPTLLTAQLVEISKMWNQQRLLKGKYSCDEIRFIIKLRYPNCSEHQLRILNRIQ